MQRKDDKEGNKLPMNLIKKQKKEKKRAREKDRNKFAKKSKFCLLTLAWKTKKAVKLHQISRKICLFSCKNLFLAILMLISRGLVQRRGIGEKKNRFFRYSPTVTKEFSRVRWAISAWITGNVVCLIGSSKLYATQLRCHYLKGAQLCSTIYGATEGLIGVNLWSLEDTPCYLLVPRSMFFEFVGYYLVLRCTNLC